MRTSILRCALVALFTGFFVSASYGIVVPVTVEGTGEVGITLTIPFATIQPVKVEAQRVCAGCGPYALLSYVWPQHTVTGYTDPNATWFEVEPTLDTLNAGQGGRFKEPGTYNVRLSAKKTDGDWVVLKVVKGVRVFNLDFTLLQSCRSGNEVRVILDGGALQEVNSQSNATVKIGGLPAVSSPLSVLSGDHRRFQTKVLMTTGQYASLQGVAKSVTLSFGGKSRVKSVTFSAPTVCTN